MAANNARGEGIGLPVPGDIYTDIPLSDLEPNAESWNSIHARGSASGGPHSSRPSDADFDISSRLGPNDTFRTVVGQSALAAVTSSLDGPASSPVYGLRLVKSQNDLQASGSAGVVPSSTNTDRQTDSNSVEFLEDLSPIMGRNDNDRLNLSEEIKYEMLNVGPQSLDTTGSTIEGIVAHYDGCSPSLKVKHKYPREYRVDVDWPLYQPPQRSLPELPSTDLQPVAMQQSEYDSPIPDSSITNSQHLLDAEAQAHELGEARRALVPSPLKISQARYGIDTTRGQQYDVYDNRSDRIIDDNPTYANDLEAHQNVQGYKIYLQAPMERDISQGLRHLCGNGEHSIGTFRSSDVNDYVPQQIKPQGKIFNPARLPKVSGQKQLRHINVILGTESGAGEDTQEPCNAQDDVKPGCGDRQSEDSDWVTESTTDSRISALRCPSTKRFKRTGSSLANYSDDGNEGAMVGFGSCERIIEDPADGEPPERSEIQRPNSSKLALLLPSQHNAFLRNDNRVLASTTQQVSNPFRPHGLSKNTNSIRGFGSQRMVFNFNENAPPKYEFRDSISEYEPTRASIGATYGSSIPKIGGDHHNVITDARLDQFTQLDGDGNPSDNYSRQSKSHNIPHDDQGMQPSIYATERERQRRELELQNFAAASSNYDPTSASSARSKFDFELVPLEQARYQNKLQRDSGETNETESARARLKRKQSPMSINSPTSTIEPPPRAFFTSRELSSEFSAPDWLINGLDAPPDTPAPFLVGEPAQTMSNDASQHQRSSSRESVNSIYPFGIPSTTRYPCSIPPTWNRRQPKRQRRFVAPDDYVSDWAHKTRRSFFYTVAVLSIIPVFAILELCGGFKKAYKWATYSEVDRLTARQRHFIKWLLAIEAVVYIGLTVGFVTWCVEKNKKGN